MEGDAGFVREGTDVVLCLRASHQLLWVRERRGTNAGRSDAAEGSVAGRADVVENNVELVDVVLSLEDRSSSQQLCEHASDGPDVDCRFFISFLLSWHTKKDALAVV